MIVYICKTITNKLKTIEIMTNSRITKTETIEATEFTMEANVITLDSVPTVDEQNELFGYDDSIVLEF